jgi:hypothetical protein
MPFAAPGGGRASPRGRAQAAPRVARAGEPAGGPAALLSRSLGGRASFPKIGNRFPRRPFGIRTGCPRSDARKRHAATIGSRSAVRPPRRGSAVGRRERRLGSGGSGPRCFEPRPRAVGHGAEELRQHPVQRARPDQRRQRRPAAARLDLLGRRQPRAGGGAAGGRQYHVRGRPAPEQSVRPRRHHRRPQVGVPAADGARGDRGRVLRRRQPRRGLQQRQAVLQHARQPHGGGRRQDRQRGLAHQARRYQHRLDDDDGAARREGQGAGRQQRRRDGGARLAHRARRKHRRDRLARPIRPAPTKTC